MGLRFSDALRLGWGNIAGHKGRSIVVILTISVLFGAVMAFNLMLEGLRGSILEAALQKNDGKVYLETGYQNLAEFGNGADRVEKVEDWETLDQYVKDEVTKYHGKVLGEITSYQLNFPIVVLDERVAEIFGDLDLSEVPEGKVPVIAPSSEVSSYSFSDDVFYEVGTFPTTQQGSPTLPGFNPLNLLLGMVYGDGTLSMPYIVDDGSGIAQEYIMNKLQEKVSDGVAYESVEQYLDVWPVQTRFVAEFDNYEDAVAYYYDSYADGIPHNVETDGKKWVLFNYDLFGRIIYLKLDFDSLQVMLVAVEVLFIVAAVIIATLTFAHLIDQDAATVALYRSLGATTRDIYLIYFLYLLELCVLAVASCVVVAMVIVIVMSVINSRVLAERLKEFYALKDLPKVSLWGINGMIFWVIGAIMIIAPVALLFTLRRFSRRHIAKKLKEC